MAPTLDNTTSLAYDSINSLTMAHTTGTQAKMVMIVGASFGFVRGAEACTYAGVAATLLGNCGGADGNSFLWYVLNPATGANNVVVSWNPSATWCRMTARTYYLVGSLGAAFTNTASSTTPTVTVTDARGGGLVVDNVGYSSACTPTLGSGQTNLANMSGQCFASQELSTAASVVMDYSCSGGGGNWGTVAVCLYGLAAGNQVIWL